MSILLHKSNTQIETSDSIIGFEKTGSEWDRFLTIDRKPAYHIGNGCDTCSFFFERLPGANKNISPKAFAQQLRNGLEMPDTNLIELASKLMPAGNYVVLFLETTLQIVQFGTPSDYFTNEQVVLWGIDSFWGFPHHPKIQYYRCPPKRVKSNEQLFEFVVPMFPQNWLDQSCVSECVSRFEADQKPTALAISVLDVKQPATWEGNPEITTHWCLAHYLLDGHHKVFAASKENSPITLLSFLAINQGVATPEEIETMINVLDNKSVS